MKSPIQQFFFLLCSFILSYSTVNAEQANYQLHAKELSEHIGKYWLLNKGDTIQGKCTIHLMLTSTGYIETINMNECMGNVYLQKIALKSISQALPFPVPEDAIDFEKFKDMKIYFDAGEPKVIEL